jgi:hypothetical protein
MNDPDGMVQTIREQEKHIADLELRLKLRDKRIIWWQGMASDLYDELIGFYRPESDPFGSITATSTIRGGERMNLSDYVTSRHASQLYWLSGLSFASRSIAQRSSLLETRSSSVSRCRLGEHPTTLNHVKRPVLSRSPARHRSRVTEQMNASTSCLGRLAGLMMSFPKMASLEEVVNRQTEEKPKSFSCGQTVGSAAPPSQGSRTHRHSAGDEA